MRFYQKSTLYLVVFIVLNGIFLSFHSFGQLPVKEFKEGDYIDSLSAFKEIYGSNKIIPQDYELPVLLTLSYYPELKDISIEFVQKNIKTTMATRPALSKIYKTKRKRHFKIYINTNSNKLPGALLQDFPFNAQIGIIAHEFEHIKEYLRNNCLELCYTGAAYLCSGGFKAKYERQTEMNTIKKGFGWQVIAFSTYLFNRSDVSSTYLEYKRSYYFSPSDISAIIMQESMY